MRTTRIALQYIPAFYVCSFWSSEQVEEWVYADIANWDLVLWQLDTYRSISQSVSHSNDGVDGATAPLYCLDIGGNHGTFCVTAKCSSNKITQSYVSTG